MVNFIGIILELIFPPRCLTCRRLGDQILCAECEKQIKPAVDAVGLYEGVLKTAILKLKFKGKKTLAEPLGKLMAEFLKVSLQEKIDLIIPVPLHENRLKSRGFNQSELLAEVIAERIGIPFESKALVRSRDTRPQFDLKINERLKNVEGAFAIKDPAKIRGKLILLIDDILTTGATARECRKVLKESGAERVHIFTLAKA